MSAMRFTGHPLTRAWLGASVCLVFFLTGAVATRAQSNQASPKGETAADLDTKLRALSDSLEQTRVELSESRAEIRELRGMLEQVLKKDSDDAHVAATTEQTPAPVAIAAGTNADANAANANAGAPQAQLTATGDNEQPAKITQDEWQIFKERLDELHQLKVESGSKYRLKLSGLVLLNVSGISGQVDNTDVPAVAEAPGPGASPGSVGATLRQTILGLDGIGPTIWGARTSGDVQMDFFGGLPSGYGADTSGLARLRVARIRLDWTNTSIVGGLDVPFFSPNMPTTYLTVAQPAFAAAGNLWAWAPTVRVEQKFDTSLTQLKVQAGLMDAPVYADTLAGERNPSPGESSRQLTYAVRVSANGRDEDRPMSFGFSAVYSPQRYPNDAGVSGWGTIGDWRFPIERRLELSGQIFDGRGLDGFGGVPTLPVGEPYYGFGMPPGAALEEITMFGGWAQLKWKADTRSEFNFAAGMGGRDSGELRALGATNDNLSYYAWPRNQSFLVNYIFRPRSDLVFSPEFRRLRTYPLTGAPMFANQYGVSAGFLF